MRFGLLHFRQNGKVCGKFAKPYNRKIDAHLHVVLACVNAVLDVVGVLFIRIQAFEFEEFECGWLGKLGH